MAQYAKDWPQLIEWICAEMPSNKKSLSLKDENEEFKFGTTFASKMLAKVSEKVLQFMEKIVDIVSAMFGSVEKTFASKGFSDIDKTVASCMMLAVAVLLIVVLKRIPGKWAVWAHVC